MLGWEGPGLPVLSNFAGPVQHFRAAVLEVWRNEVSADLWAGKGFRGGPLLDISGTVQPFNSGHVRERDKALLWSVLAGGVGMVFFWRMSRASKCHVGSVAVLVMMVISSGTVPFPPLVGILEMDKSYWPRCLLWHGWLLLLSGINGGSPWAETPADGAGNLLECALGPFTSNLLGDWQLPWGLMLRVQLSV